MDQFPLYLIPLLPLAGAAANLLLGRRFGKGFVTAVGVTTVAGACLLSWLAAAGHGIHIAPGLLLDRLSSLMTLVITTVGAFIHYYSTAYMADDDGYHRYF